MNSCTSKNDDLFVDGELEAPEDSLDDLSAAGLIALYGGVEVAGNRSE